MFVYLCIGALKGAKRGILYKKIPKMVKKEDLNSDLKRIYNRMVKSLDWIVIIIIILSIPFLLTIFFKNYVATAIGLIILGFGVTIKLFDLKKVPTKVYVIIWSTIIIIISVLLGIQYLIPKINFS